MLDADVFKFKFRFVNESGNEEGFTRTRGTFDGETLMLGDAEIPAAGLTSCEVRETRMALGAIDEDGDAVGVIISSDKGSLATLKRKLDAARSESWAEHHRKELVEQGRGSAFRSSECPNCNAQIILTDMPDIPQIYCHFCDSLMTHNTSMSAKDERDYRLCDACGMFSKPRRFTVFYFYFLLVVYGWSQNTTTRCPACMRADAWKMLFGNLLFVLGVPVAITQLVRSYGGEVTGTFAGLNAANLKAGKQDLSGALRIYNDISDRVPHCAGIKYNLGMALLGANKTEQAARAFEAALGDCGNYAPAYGALAHCYEQLGETAKLKALNDQWGVEQANEQLSDGSDDVVLERQ